MDSERAEVAVVDPQRLNELVGVGQGVDVGPAEPVDPAGNYRVGGLGGDAVQVAAEDGPRVSRIDGLVDVGDVEGIDLFWRGQMAATPAQASLETSLTRLNDDGRALLFTEAPTANTFSDRPVTGKQLREIYEL